MIRSTLLSALAVAAVLAAGCRSPGAADAPSPLQTGGEQSQPRRDPSRLLESELRDGGFRTAYDAVEALHSNWLRPEPGARDHGARSPSVAVFLDGQKADLGLDYLRQIGAGSFKEIRRLSARESHLRYGTSYSWGALVIITR
ncbi:MAG: hypothetical protein M3373_01395 [Gemmatimonadota bacterium]|nr:hypothetical protein [Gemmatimonadota bacterium]